MSDTGYGDFEFERKFVLDGLPAVAATEADPVLIVQSYLVAADGYAVRVRVQAPGAGLRAPDLAAADDVLEAMAPRVEFAAITAKGPHVGGTRYEAERELDPQVAVELVRRGPHHVVKLRHALWLGEDGWVIDEFAGDNAPLVVAECERGGPVVDLVIPDFCVSEVTADTRFGNEHLAVEPYAGWRQTFERELAVTGPVFSQEFGQNRLPR
ncbi:MAG: adenylate cyclase [Actinomycetaceae bacterium]